MIVLSEAEGRELMSLDLAYSAVQRALVAAVDGSSIVNPVVIGRGLSAGETFSIKSGAAHEERVVGLKVGSYWPNNLAAGLAPHGSSIFLLDPATGRLAAVVEASRLNGPRTAAADAVAANLLARDDARTLSVIGAGHQAEFEVRALCAIRPIQRVLLVSRTEARATALRDKLSADLNVRIESVNVEQACREADILVTVTPSRAPLFDASWLEPGTHVASMGSDQAGKQELPPALLHRARLFCDVPSQSIAVGELQHVRADIEAGRLAVTAIGDVLLGRAQGRLSPEEITVFDSSGFALQDLFVANSLLEKRERASKAAEAAMLSSSQPVRSETRREQNHE